MRKLFLRNMILGLGILLLPTPLNLIPKLGETKGILLWLVSEHPIVHKIHTFGKGLN